MEWHIGKTLSVSVCFSNDPYNLLANVKILVQTSILLYVEILFFYLSKHLKTKNHAEHLFLISIQSSKTINQPKQFCYGRGKYHFETQTAHC